MIYQGLVNQGSTCYLNSLIQTLFMTYQFRTNVYSYTHDPKKIQEKDSIPYQLQKLFVNLQTSQYPCFTKDLLKSFQWTQAQSFQQHDVQQFCRILFDAIQASHKNTLWIKQLFGFIMSSYIESGVHKSTRTQQYLDISLPVKNIYNKATYSSVEQCLKEYFMPQTIEGVQFEGIKDKLTAQKGFLLQSLPSILTIQLNRFQLNYDTFQRQKVNSFLYYPQLLQLHRFMKPYNEISIKGIPKDLQSRSIFVPKQKSKRTMDLSIPTVSQNSKKRRGSDDKITVKEHVSYFDAENANKRGPQIKQLSTQQQRNKNLQILAALKQDKFTNLQKLVNKKKQQKVNLVQEQQDMLFGTLAQGYSFQKPEPSSLGSSNYFKPTFQNGQTQYQHEQESFDRNKQYPEGTYALYAVLIHSGGSHGGHYYAYISDGQNWYKFDDSKVTKVQKTQIRKYGSNSETTNGTNAYLLFYRKTTSFRQVKNIQIPNQLLQKVIMSNKASEVQQQKLRERQLQRQKRNLQMQQSLLIKVYVNDKDQPKTIKIANKSKQSVRQLKQRVKVMLGIQQTDEDWRMRRYNKQDNSMHEIYDKGLYELSLESAGFRQYVTVIIQFKKPDESFQDYDPNKITIKINVWQKDIIMLTQKLLKPIKIQIHSSSNYESLFEQIKRATQIDNLLVIKRNYTGISPISALALKQNRNKTLTEMKFFNNLNLYVEQNTETVKPKWCQQFQNEKYRCYIKFNNPKLGESRDEQMYFDSRRTLGQLKKTIAEHINIPEDQFRMKKGKQLPQLITYKKRLNDLKFISNQILYIQEGRSSLGVIALKRGSVELIEDQIQFLLHQQMQIQLTPQIITIENLCQAISTKTGLPSEQIRIRQYLSSQFRQIYTRNDLIQKYRHKNLIYQFIQCQQQRGLQIYYRVFNVMTFQLGQLREVFIDNNATYEQFALVVQENCAISHNKILTHKCYNSFVDKAVLFDCDWTEIRYLSGTIKESPLDIRCDGQIIIIKQAEAAYQRSKKHNKTQKSKHGGQDKLTITVIAQNQIDQALLYQALDSQGDKN